MSFAQWELTLEEGAISGNKAAILVYENYQDAFVVRCDVAESDVVLRYLFEDRSIDKDVAEQFSRRGVNLVYKGDDGDLVVSRGGLVVMDEVVMLEVVTGRGSALQLLEAIDSISVAVEFEGRYFHEKRYPIDGSSDFRKMGDACK
jgi:hypothetical protein